MSQNALFQSVKGLGNSKYRPKEGHGRYAERR